MLVDEVGPARRGAGGEREVLEMDEGHCPPDRILAVPGLDAGAKLVDLRCGQQHGCDVPGAVSPAPCARRAGPRRAGRRVRRPSDPRSPCRLSVANTSMSMAFSSGLGPAAIVNALVACETSQVCAASRSAGSLVACWNTTTRSVTRAVYSSAKRMTASCSCSSAAARSSAARSRNSRLVTPHPDSTVAAATSSTSRSRDSAGRMDHDDAVSPRDRIRGCIVTARSAGGAAMPAVSAPKRFGVLPAGVTDLVPAGFRTDTDVVGDLQRVAALRDGRLPAQTSASSRSRRGPEIRRCCRTRSASSCRASATSRRIPGPGPSGIALSGRRRPRCHCCRSTCGRSSSGTRRRWRAPRRSRIAPRHTLHSPLAIAHLLGVQRPSMSSRLQSCRRSKRSARKSTNDRTLADRCRRLG